MAVNWDDGDIFRRCFLFCIDGKSDAEAGMMELDRKCMTSILEERSGYAAMSWEGKVRMSDAVW